MPRKGGMRERTWCVCIRDGKFKTSPHFTDIVYSHLAAEFILKYENSVYSFKLEVSVQTAQLCTAVDFNFFSALQSSVWSSLRPSTPPIGTLLINVPCHNGLTTPNSASLFTGAFSLCPALCKSARLNRNLQYINSQ